MCKESILNSKYREGFTFQTNLSGECVVVNYKNSKEVLVRFVETGYETVVQANKISTGAIKDHTLPTVYGVGYNNQGNYPSSEITEKGTRTTKAYSTWVSMIQRCYSKENHHKNPTYADCGVNSVWHYYQNFAEFFYEDPWRQPGWTLEKDLLVKGNREYGPDTCVFAPRDINAFACRSQNSRGEFPIGVHYKKANSRYGATYRDGKGLLVHIGYFSTPEDAFYAFKEKKEALAKQIADKWKDAIDPRLYQALYRYTVEISD